MLAAALAAGLSGCFCHVKREDPVVKDNRLLGKTLPPGCRNHCFLFFLHGCDPIDCIDLAGLVERLQDLGYIKTYEGECFHHGAFAKEIRRIHKEDPMARFVLLGDGKGARNARDLATVVGQDSITIDLLVSLNGGKMGDRRRPQNVLQVVNIQGKNADDPAPMASAVNFNLPDVREFGLATRPEVVHLILQELIMVASRVPVVEKAPPPNRFEEPTPKPIKAVPPGPRDEWDFLLPAVPATPQKPPTSRPPQPAPATPPPGGGPTTSLAWPRG